VPFASRPSGGRAETPARDPDHDAAVESVAARHRRSPADVLLTSGPAEAFTLIARALAPKFPVVIHPQIGGAESALRAAGHDVRRLVLEPPFALNTRLVPAAADLVVVGNPTDPTSVLHHREAVRALIRSHRLVVVDETLADCDPGEAHSVANELSVVVVRSIGQPAALPDESAGYLLAGVALIQQLREVQERPPSAAAVKACLAYSTPQAVAQVAEWATTLRARRRHLVRMLSAVPGIEVVAGAGACFVLAHVAAPGRSAAVRAKGFQVRVCDDVPGLGPEWIKVQVGDRRSTAALVAAFTEADGR
jgi:histidinol-phosphate aminotransferase